MANGLSYYGTLRNQFGEIVADADVTVYFGGTTGLAPVYSDKACTSLLAGSVVKTDARGYFLFYLDTDVYPITQPLDLVFSKAVHETKTYAGVR